MERRVCPARRTCAVDDASVHMVVRVGVCGGRGGGAPLVVRGERVDRVQDVAAGAPLKLG